MKSLINEKFFTNLITKTCSLLKQVFLNWHFMTLNFQLLLLQQIINFYDIVSFKMGVFAADGFNCFVFYMGSVKKCCNLFQEDYGVVIDFVKPVEGSSIYRVLIIKRVTTTKFTGVTDVETSELVEALRDL